MESPFHLVLISEFSIRIIKIGHTSLRDCFLWLWWGVGRWPWLIADVLHDVIFQIYTDDEKETVAEIKGFQKEMRRQWGFKDVDGVDND